MHGLPHLRPGLTPYVTRAQRQNWELVAPCHGYVSRPQTNATDAGLCQRCQAPSWPPHPTPANLSSVSATEPSQIRKHDPHTCLCWLFRA